MPKTKPPKKEARKIPSNLRLFVEDVPRLKLGAEKIVCYHRYKYTVLPDASLRFVNTKCMRVDRYTTPSGPD
jgi:hypothetical protein